jgi:hypothetical protein
LNPPPTAGACFDDVITNKLPVGPRLQMTGLERADRKLLIPLPALTGLPSGKLPSTLTSDSFRLVADVQSTKQRTSFSQPIAAIQLLNRLAL